MQVRLIAWTAVLALGSGCGPLLEVPDGGMSGTDSESGDPPVDVSTSNGGATSSDPTVGPISTTEPDPPRPPDFGGPPPWGSSGGSSGETGQLCVDHFEMFVISATTRLLVRDQDGDGTEELWMAVASLDGEGTQLFTVDSGGESFAGEFPGQFVDLHDVDGDGILDATGFDTIAGGPSPWRFSRGESGFISGLTETMEITFQQGSTGLGQADGDGAADFFQNRDGVLSLFVGDGSGGFGESTIAPSQLGGPVSTRSIEGDATGIVLTERHLHDPIDACIPHAFQPYRVVDGGIYPLDVPSWPEFLPPSAPLRTSTHDGWSFIFNRGCSANVSQPVGVLAHLYVGDVHHDVLASPPGVLATAGDYDGDGYVDMALAPDEGLLQLNRGNTMMWFDDTENLDVELLPPLPSATFSVDLDSDGRDEIFYGSEFGPGLVTYSWIDFHDC